MEFQSITAPLGDDDNSSSTDETEAGPVAPDELRTFIIIVNDDGSLSLDPHGVIADDADPQVVFPVSLPVNKMKSPDCPLPGATPVPGANNNRARKSKPQAVLYGGDNDGVYELNPTTTANNNPTAGNFVSSNAVPDFQAGVLQVNGSNNPGMDPNSIPVTGAGGAIDIDQLGPQDIAMLENIVLQSESGRELLENLNLPAEEIPAPTPINTSHLWDHSYSALSAPLPAPFVSAPSQQLQPRTATLESVEKIQIVEPTPVQVPAPQPPPPAVPVATVSPIPAKPSKSIIKVSFTGNNPKPSAPVAPTPRVSAGSPSPALSPSPSPSNRRISESESGANIRRSQRQQDRIERQEAERILAENQQMLQREKELMMENSNAMAIAVAKPPETPPPPPPPPPPPAPPAPPVVVAPLPPPSPVIIQREEVRVPVRVASPAIQSQASFPSSPEASPRSEKRPIRQRKLPAHLADPNYVQFEEEPKPPTAEVAVQKPPSEPVVVTPQEEEDAESTEEEADEEAGEDDDPNKLWCICRQPHNNRFMICCDKCDDWFHGKCVGVTKAQAKKMENEKVQWHCPSCRKLIKGTTPKQPKLPARTSSRRGSETSSRGSTDSQVQGPPKESIKKPEVKPVPRERQDSVSRQLGRRKSDSVSSQPEISVVEAKHSECIVCGKKRRADSVFCSDACISQKAAAAAVKEPSTPATPPVAPAVTPTTTVAPPTPSPTAQKLKRLNSKSEQEKKEALSFFDFHVIQAGATKSTEVVPARQKDPVTPPVKQSPGATTAVPPQSSEKPGPKPPSSPVKNVTPTPPPPSQPSKSSASTSAASLSLKLPVTTPKTDPKEKASPTKEKPQQQQESKSSSTPKTSKPTAASEKVSRERRRTKDSPKEPEKEKQTKSKDESMFRDNVVKTLRETFRKRLEELSEGERALFPSSNTPEFLAEQVEEELTKLYGSSQNSKYKAKYRSIYFNIKDVKNSLFREIFQGTLSPGNLVKMESSDMASAELAEWRNRENQKNLDMIKRAEIDKLVEAKKQELLDKGADVDVAAEEQARKLDIADIIQASESTSETTESDSASKSSSKSHSSSHHKKEKKHHERHKDGKHKDSKDKHGSTKERDRRDSGSGSSGGKDRTKSSERHHHRSREREDSLSDKSSSSRHKDKETDRHSKDKSKPASKEERKQHKDKDTDSKIKPRDLDTKEKAIKKSDSLDKPALTPTETPASTSAPTPPLTEPSQSKIDDSKPDVRLSSDTEQELPSSTIKTPDFTEDKKEKGEAPVFTTKLMMHELGHFRAAAFHVSHNSLQGALFPESPVPIVGRIAPETVWDYLDKMKKTKEVIVLRLAPETDADKEGYMSFFSYLSSRGRLGVMGGITSPLKDVYLIPLAKQQPVHRALLPFRGPGLPEERAHCLLAVVTRSLGEMAASMLAKRKPSTAPGDVSSPSLVKKKKVGEMFAQPSPTSTGSPRPITAKVQISAGETGPSGHMLDPRRRKVEESKVATTTTNEPDPNDDEPYTPWEDDDDKDIEMVEPAPIPKPVGLTEKERATLEELERINRRIQQEKESIEFITARIKTSENITHIPGLDGDFNKETSPVRDAGVGMPFFLKTMSEIPVTTLEDSPKMQSVVEMDDVVTETSEPKDVETAAALGTSVGADSGTSLIQTERMVESSDIGESKGEVEDVYSPSALDFVEEVNKDAPTTATATKELEVVQLLEPEPKISAAPKYNLIPGLDIPLDDTPDEPDEPSGSLQSAPEVIELDDEEPAPPGESSRAPGKPTLDSVFTLPPPNYLTAKPKIHINLAPKLMLGSSLSSSLSSSSVLASVASSAAPSSQETPSPPKPELSPFSLTVEQRLMSLPRLQSTLLVSQPKVSPPIMSPPVQQRPCLASGNLPVAANIPPPGLVTIPAIMPTNIPPPMSAMLPTNIPPPGMSPLYRAPPAQPMPVAPPPGYHPSVVPRPNLVPAPSMMGGMNININVPPPGTVGMVPVTSIPPLPTLRGMPNQMRQQPQNNNGGSPHNSQPSMGRFRPLGRFSQGDDSNNSKMLSGQSPAGDRPGGGGGSNFRGNNNSNNNNRRFFGGRNNDGLSEPSSNNYSKGSGGDRGRRNRPFGNRARSRSRTPPARNRSRSRLLPRFKYKRMMDSNHRSRSRERRRRRRYSRSRSRSPPQSSSSSRRRSRSSSPPPPPRPSRRSKSPPRRSRRSRSGSRSRSPTAKIRRRKSHSPSPGKTSSSSSSATTTAASAAATPVAAAATTTATASTAKK